MADHFSERVPEDFGKPIVEAMNSRGRRVEIIGRHRTTGFVTPAGARSGGRHYIWNGDASAQLYELRERERELAAQYQSDLDDLNVERARVLYTLEPFDYDTEVAKILSSESTR